MTAVAARKKVTTGGLALLVLTAGLLFAPPVQAGRQTPSGGQAAAPTGQGSEASSGQQNPASTPPPSTSSSPPGASGSSAAPSGAQATQPGAGAKGQPPAGQAGGTISSGQQPPQQSSQQPAQPNPPAGAQPAPAQNPPPSNPEGLQLEAPPVAPAAPKPPAGKQGQPTLGQPQQPAAGQQAPNEVIQSINFRGNRRYPSATLQARIFSHPGDVYDENALERDYMALWNTGFFDDIRLEVTDGQHGKIVTFFVREKKVVRSIDYKGLSTVTQSDVLDRFREAKVGLSIESPYDPVVVRRAEVVLQQMLAEHGRQFATVRHRTRNIPPNSVALTFVVVEGPKVKVGEIKFVGNTVFSNEKLVRAMSYTRPAGFPPIFYIFHKTYDKEKVEADLVEHVQELYREHGYFFANPSLEFKTHTVDTQRSPFLFFLGRGKGKRVDLTIPIDEGAQYRLGRFSVRGNKLFKTDALIRSFPLKTGDIFNMTRVRKSLDDYKKLYGNFGYINFVADPDIDPDRRRHIINLTLNFDEGDQYFVHRIEFSGNNKTRDKVIRRQILLDEGNLFSTSLWDISIIRVNQLGYFDQIKKEDYEITQNNQNKTVDILVKLREKGKNSIGFSGGVSGVAGTFIGINYSTNNLFGLGETFSIQAQTGTYEKLYSLGFTKPYIWDRPITAGFTIFDSQYHFDQARQIAVASGVNPNSIEQNPFTSALYQNFQQNSKGFTVFATSPWRKSFARVGLTYSYSDSNIETFSAASQQFYTSLAFGQYNGPNQLYGIKTSQIAPNYTYSTLNGALDATRGKFISASLQFAGGPLGGNVNTIRPVFEGKYYHPVRKGKNVLAFHFIASTIAGYGGKVPPPFSRFYMGGDQDIRGFDPYTISPTGFFPTIGQVCNRDAKGNPIQSVGPSGAPTGSCGSFTQFPYYTLQFPGGDTELLTNFEYRIPIVPNYVTLSYFIDVGVPFILYQNQLQFTPTALNNIRQEFPYFPVPTSLKPLAADNFRPRSSTGLEIGVNLPVVHAPVRLYYAYNWVRLNNVQLVPPQDLPPQSMFPNQATYNQVYQYFAPISIREQKGLLGFTVARQF
ncbi:MAG TPA: outer membrane protein assembly factor BamA [Terriglobia bacterium]